MDGARNLSHQWHPITPFCSSKFSAKKGFGAARSVKILPIKLISVGKNRKDGFETVVLTYLEKVRRYCDLEDVQVRSNPENASDVLAQVKAEGTRVLRHISAKDWVVVLDEHGQDLTSEKFARVIEDARDRNIQHLVFCIGGPYGHSTKVLSRANMKVRLSYMVLNHQVALVVLLEQIYRAWTIVCGERYHH